MKKIILIVSIVLVVLGVGGYFIYTKLIKSNTSSSGIISKVTLNPNCKYNDPDLCKFINGWKDVKYYTYTSNDTDKDGKKSQSILKLAGSDHTQMIVLQDSKESYNTITIANTTYTKDYSDNKWWKMTSKPNDSTVKTQEEDKLKFDNTTIEDKTTYKKIGTEACGKLTCFKYQVIDPTVTDSTEYIYFDNKDYQLRKMRSEMKDGSVSEATIDYSKISISEPSPTKDGSPLQGTLPTTTPSTNSSSSTTPSNTSTPSSTDSSSLDQTPVPTDIPVGE